MGDTSLFAEVDDRKMDGSRIQMTFFGPDNCASQISKTLCQPAWFVDVAVRPDL
jgi:hypothetical protein